MNTEQILKVLKNERECIERQAGMVKDGYYVSLCDRNCAKCDLCLPDTEILEVYDHLIKITETSSLILTVSEEDKKSIVEYFQNKGYLIGSDVIEKYGLKGGME